MKMQKEIVADVIAMRAELSPDREAFYETLRMEYAKRYKTFDPSSVEVLFNILQTFAMGEARLAARIQRKGLTLSGLNVLTILRRYGAQGCPQNLLSHLLLVSRANITGVIDSLVRKGFVIRQDHVHDRRVILAKITADGDEWLDQYLPDHYKEIRDMFSGVSHQEKQELSRLLLKLRRTSGYHPRDVR